MLFLHEFLHGAIYRVRDVDFALGTHRDKVSFAEFAHSVPGFSHSGENFAVQIQP